MNRWKVAFFALLLIGTAAGAWAGSRLFDQSVWLAIAETTIQGQHEEDNFKTTLLDHALVGKSKQEFIQAVLRVKHDAAIKDDPPILWVDATAYEFDAAGRYVRQVRPE